MNKRIDCIDGWRIIAAMGVLFTHTWATLKFPALSVGKVDLMQMINLFGHGVQLFFVISGFCFYLVLTKKGTYDLQTAMAFWKKRWLRIAPAFYFVCLVTALLHFDFFKKDLLFRLFFNFIFLQNHIHSAEIDTIFWSLAVEWHFYLLLPLIFVLIRKVNITRAICILLGIHLVLNLLHYKGLLMPGDSWWYTIFANLGNFVWGIFTGYLFANQIRIPLLSKSWSIGLGLAIAYVGKLFFFSGFVAKMHSLGFVFQSIGPLIMTLGFACMIYSSLASARWSNIIGNKYSAALGKISYSFYLWHNLTLHFVYDTVGKFLPSGAGGVFLLMLAALVILIPVSYLSYSIFESFYFRQKKVAWSS